MTFYDQIRNAFGDSSTPLKAMSPLTLAFVGDAVYTLVISTMVVDKGNTANEKLHKKQRGWSLHGHSLTRWKG